MIASPRKKREMVDGVRSNTALLVEDRHFRLDPL